MRDLRDRGVDDDRAVHLRELVEKLRRERLVELDAAGEHERQLRRLADHDQGAFARADDVVDSLSQRRARSYPRDRAEDVRVDSRIELSGAARKAE